jgi:hypothetical protein
MPLRVQYTEMKQKYFLTFHKQQAALFSVAKGQLKIEHVQTFENNVKPLDILRPLLAGKEVELVSALPSSDICLRKVSLKLKSKREILATLPFQVENLLPYPQEEMLLLPSLVPAAKGTEVFLLATQLAALERHLEEHARVGIDPDQVYCEPVALLGLAKQFFPKIGSLFILHGSAEIDTLVVVKEGNLEASLSVKPRDSERAFALIQKKYPEIEHILLLDKEPPSSLLTPLRLEDPLWEEYALPLGLAFACTQREGPWGHFRQGELLSKKERVRKKRAIQTFSAACLGFCLVAIPLGHLQIKKREKAILNAIGFTNESSLKKVEKNLEAAIYGPKKETLVTNSAPKAHEVLTWLSTHPKLPPSASIETLRYELVKAPSIGSSSKLSSAKVELEVAIEKPLDARSFHEALLKERVWIDQRQQVKWSGGQGLYKASFFLKASGGR